MDSRDFASIRRKIFDMIDEKKMTATVSIVYDDCDEVVEVPMKYEVCGLCNGKGSHVNPSIDSNGLSYEDFEEDPDFREEYFSGRYDIPCNECNGKRVICVLDEERAGPVITKQVRDTEQAEHDYAMERYHEMRMGY